MKRGFVSRYLDEMIDFGGEMMTRGEVILTMQQEGVEQGCIDRWLQGQEFMARVREKREGMSLKLYVADQPRKRRRPRGV